MLGRYLVSGAVVLSVVAACAPKVGVVYDIGLKEVSRPASAREQYGEQRVTRLDAQPLVGDSTLRRATFEDGLVRISWGVTSNEAFFTAENKTEHTIAITWDRAAMVMPDGTSSAVMHDRVRYAECGNSKVPSVIVPGSKIVDAIVPCATVKAAPSVFGWGGYIFETDPFAAGARSWAGSATADPEKLASVLNKRDRGSVVRVMLPIEIEGVTNEYTFTFTVDSVFAAKRERR